MNLLLVDGSVPDYQVFLDSVNDSTCAVLYSPTTTSFELNEMIHSKTTSVERIGVVFRKENNRFVDNKFLLESKDEFVSMIKELGVKHIDFLGCNTLKDPEWKELYDTLEKETGVVVGASSDLTGNLKYGGNWVMESTREDIEHIYFTNKIEYYKYLLDLGNHSLIVCNDGLYATGSNSFGELGIPSYQYIEFFTKNTSDFFTINSKNVQSISSGLNFTMVLLTNGDLYGIGDNTYGQLGISKTTYPYTRTFIRVQIGVSQVSCGHFHTMIIKPVTSETGTANEVFGTGLNDRGQVGLIQGTASVDTFIQVDFGRDATQVSCGFKHTMIIKPVTSATGTVNQVFGAGLNNQGQLGLNRETYSFYVFRFMLVESGEGATQLSCGENHTMIIKLVTSEEGTVNQVFGTGLNNNGINLVGQLGLGPNLGGQLGLNKTTLSVDTFTIVPSGEGATQVSCGANHTMIIKDSNVYGAGYNDKGQLGLNKTSLYADTFTIVPSGEGVTQLSCGDQHTMIIKQVTSTNGTVNQVFGTGLNDHGQLGIIKIPYDTKDSFTLVDSGASVNKLFCGNSNTMIIKNGILYGAGRNYYSVLGKPEINKVTTLTKVPFNLFMNIKSIHYGNQYTVLLLKNGNLYGTGNNIYGQLGVNRSVINDGFKLIETGVTEVSCGNSHTMIIKNGILYGAGYNWYGQLGINESRQLPKYSFTSIRTGVKTVSCGDNHTMIIEEVASTEGTVNQLFGTGYNDKGQLGLNISDYPESSTFTPVVSGEGATQVSCGHSHTMIIKQVTSTEGTVNKLYGAGNNNKGQLGINNYQNAESFTPVVSGEGATQVSCGFTHTMIIKPITSTDGTVNKVYGAGGNESGQLGLDRQYSLVDTFTQVDSGTGAIQVFCNYSCSMIVIPSSSTEGTVYTLYVAGENTYGNLGINSYYAFTFTPVDYVSGVKFINKRMIDETPIVITEYITEPTTTSSITVPLKTPISPLSAGAFTYESSNTKIATIVGNILTVLDRGTTTITVTQAAYGIYSAVVETYDFNTGAFVVDPELIDFTTVVPTVTTSLAVTLKRPTAPPGVAFTYQSSNQSVATIIGNILTVVGIGTTIITVTQAAYGVYRKKSETYSFDTTTFLRDSPELIDFTTVVPTVTTSLAVTLKRPTAPPGVAFTYQSSNQSVATIIGNILTVVGIGTTTITVTQAAYGVYREKTATYPFSTTTFLRDSPELKDFTTVVPPDTTSLTVILKRPTAPTGVAFTYQSSNENVATIEDNVLTVVGIGTTTITVTQAAYGVYREKTATYPFITTTFLRNPTLTLFTTVVPQDTTNLAVVLNRPESPSDGEFTYKSSNENVATVEGDVLTVVGIGTTTIKVTQAAYGVYRKKSETYSFDTTTFLRPAGITDYLTEPSSLRVPLNIPNSPSAGAFTYESIDQTIATIIIEEETGTPFLTVVGLGNATIRITQAADGVYETTSVEYDFITQDFTGEYIPYIDFYIEIPPDYTFGDTITINDPISESAGTFSYTSKNTDIATIDGNVVTILNKGMVTIEATQAEYGLYSANTITTTLDTIGLFPKAFLTRQFVGYTTEVTNIDTLTLPDSDETYLTLFGDDYVETEPYGILNLGENTFLFGGIEYDTIFINLNGSITFDTTVSTPLFESIPLYAGVYPFIADLNTIDPEYIKYKKDDITNTAIVVYKTSLLNNEDTSDISIKVTFHLKDSAEYGKIVIEYGDIILPETSTQFNAGISFGSSFNTNYDFTTEDLFSENHTKEGYAPIFKGYSGITLSNTSVTITQSQSEFFELEQLIFLDETEWSLPDSYVDNPTPITNPTSDSYGTFTYKSSNKDVATTTLSDDGTWVLTVVGIGTTTITVTQAQDGRFTSHSLARVFITTLESVGKNSVFSFVIDIPNPLTSREILLVDPTDSDNTVGAFTYESSDPTVATITDRNKLNIVGKGPVTITAIQQESESGLFIDTYVECPLSDEDISRFFPETVLTTNHTILQNPTLRTITLNTLSEREGIAKTAPIFYEITSGDATIDGNVLTINSEGDITIKVSQYESGIYDAAEEVYTIYSYETEILFKQTNLIFDPVIKVNPTVRTIRLSATSDRVGIAKTEPIFYEITSGDATIDGNVLTINSPDNISIKASQNASGIYEYAERESIIYITDTNRLFLDTFLRFNTIIPVKPVRTIRLSVTSDRVGIAKTEPILYTTTSVNASISGKVLTINGPGEIIITASQPASGIYNAADAEYTIPDTYMSKIFPETTFIEPLTINIPTNPNKINLLNIVAPISNRPGKFTYISSDPSIATIFGNKIIVKGNGTALITAKQLKNGLYEEYTTNEVVTLNTASYFP